MKSRIILGVLAAVMVVGMISIIALGADKRGNGLPKGKSYNFNVIGVPKDKNWDPNSGGEGKRIFILRTGTTWFYVQGGTTFDIVDHDGTDGKVGSGGTPTADPNDIETGITNAGIILPYASGTWNCRVFVRLLGPVDSSFRWTSYYFDDTNSEWAQISQFTLDRSTKFSERTEQILEDGYEDILWQWDQKNDFRICQFRIFVEDQKE